MSAIPDREVFHAPAKMFYPRHRRSAVLSIVLELLALAAIVAIQWGGWAFEEGQLVTKGGFHPLGAVLPILFVIVIGALTWWGLTGWWELKFTAHHCAVFVPRVLMEHTLWGSWPEHLYRPETPVGDADWSLNMLAACWEAYAHDAVARLSEEEGADRRAPGRAVTALYTEEPEVAGAPQQLPLRPPPPYVILGWLSGPRQEDNHAVHAVGPHFGECRLGDAEGRFRAHTTMVHDVFRYAEGRDRLDSLQAVIEDWMRGGNTLVLVTRDGRYSRPRLRVIGFCPAGANAEDIQVCICLPREERPMNSWHVLDLSSSRGCEGSPYNLEKTSFAKSAASMVHGYDTYKVNVVVETPARLRLALGLPPFE